MGFHFKIAYNLGASNRVAHALSRREPSTTQLGTLCSSSWVDWSDLDQEVSKDEMLNSIK